MAEHATADQVGRICDLVDQLGLSDIDRFRRLRAIVGYPVNALRQLTPDQADKVITELEADTGQLPLGGS